jgi:hypothetical protein
VNLLNYVAPAPVYYSVNVFQGICDNLEFLSSLALAITIETHPQTALNLDLLSHSTKQLAFLCNRAEKKKGKVSDSRSLRPFLGDRH